MGDNGKGFNNFFFKNPTACAFQKKSRKGQCFLKRSDGVAFNLFGPGTHL